LHSIKQLIFLRKTVCFLWNEIFKYYSHEHLQELKQCDKHISPCPKNPTKCLQT